MTPDSPTPLPFQGRPYAGSPDFARLLDLHRACTTRETLYDFPSRSDLHTLLAEASPQAPAPPSGDPAVAAAGQPLDRPPRTRQATRVWEDAAGDLVAYALFAYPSTVLAFGIHPRALGLDLLPQILDWGLAWLSADRVGRGAHPAVWCRCHDLDSRSRRALEAHQFRRARAQDLRLVRSLDAPLPDAQVPAGFRLRRGVGPAELPAYQELHRAAFAGISMALDYHRSPAYQPDLDLIALAADGNFAAFCLAELKEVADMRAVYTVAEIAVIATHPAYRQQGLGRALLLSALRGVQERSGAAVFLETEQQNRAARRLYAAAGFTRVSTWHWYTREV